MSPDLRVPDRSRRPPRAAWRRRGLALALAALGAAAACGPPASPAVSIAAEALLARIEAGDAPLVLDVRSEEEFRAGHVPGARLLPHDELATRLAELEPARDQEVVVYCERGGRAARAENLLREAGFARVLHLEGDMAAWRQAGRRMEGL